MVDVVVLCEKKRSWMPPPRRTNLWRKELELLPSISIAFSSSSCSRTSFKSLTPNTMWSIKTDWGGNCASSSRFKLEHQQGVFLLVEGALFIFHFLIAILSVWYYPLEKALSLSYRSSYIFVCVCVCVYTLVLGRPSSRNKQDATTFGMRYLGNILKLLLGTAIPWQELFFGERQTTTRTERKQSLALTLSIDCADAANKKLPSIVTWGSARYTNQKHTVVMQTEQIQHATIRSIQHLFFSFSLLRVRLYSASPSYIVEFHIWPNLSFFPLWTIIQMVFHHNSDETHFRTPRSEIYILLTAMGA